MVTRVKRAEKAKQEDDPHGLLTHGPNWTNRQNDPHGLLANRPKSAHKQGAPPGTLTTKGTQPTHVHDDNPNRVTPSKPGAQAGHPARDLSTERRYQLRPTMGKIVVSILGLLVLISMIIQGNNMKGNTTITNTRRNYRTQLRPEITEPHGTHSRGHHMYKWRKRFTVPEHSEEVRTRAAVAKDMPTAPLNDKNRTQTRKPQRPHTPQTADRPKAQTMTPTHKTLVNTNKGRLNKPWLQPQGSIIPTNQHRNPGGKCHIPWAIGNQVLAHYHHYDQHQGNVIVRKFLVTYQIYHRKTNAHKTNTQSRKPITNATAGFRAVTEHTTVLWANPANPPEEEAEVATKYAEGVHKIRPKWATRQETRGSR